MIIEYIRKALKSLSFWKIFSNPNKKQQLEKVKDYYEKIGKKTEKIQIK